MKSQSRLKKPVEMGRFFFLKLVESEFCNPTDFLCNSTDLTDNSIFRQMVSHTPPKEPRVA
jgi:hypothetical protein